MSADTLPFLRPARVPDSHPPGFSVVNSAADILGAVADFRR